MPPEHGRNQRNSILPFYFVAKVPITEPGGGHTRMFIISGERETAAVNTIDETPDAIDTRRKKVLRCSSEMLVCVPPSGVGSPLGTGMERELQEKRNHG